MAAIVGVLLTIIAVVGLCILIEWMLYLSAYVRARLRASAPPHARDGDDEDEDLFI